MSYVSSSSMTWKKKNSLADQYQKLYTRMGVRVQELQLFAIQSLPSYDEVLGWNAEDLLEVHVSSEDLDLIRAAEKVVDVSSLYYIHTSKFIAGFALSLEHDPKFVMMLPSKWMEAPSPLTAFLTDTKKVSEDFTFVSDVFKDAHNTLSRRYPTVGEYKRGMGVFTKLIEPEASEYRYSLGMPSPIDMRKVSDILVPYMLVEKKKVKEDGYAIRITTQVLPNNVRISLPLMRRGHRASDSD